MPIFNEDCRYCKQHFTVKRQSSKPPTYCSHRCYVKDKRKISVEYKLNCLHCSLPFTDIKPKHLPAPKFCSHLCYGLNKRQPLVLKNGYVVVHKPNHPRTNCQGKVRLHLLVMEEKIGRPVKRTESVHHIDGNKLNNHPDNLELFSSHTEHLLHHWREKTLRKTRGGSVRSSGIASPSKGSPDALGGL